MLLPLLNLALLMAVGVLFYVCHGQHERLKNIESRLKEPRLIAIGAAQEHWRAEMQKYPEGSPKHTAFKNRLRRVGAE